MTLDTDAPRDIPGVVPYFYSGLTCTVPGRPDCRAPDGITSQLINAGFGTAAELAKYHVKNRIAVVEVQHPSGPGSTFATAFANVQQQGALAMIAVTDGPDDYPVQQDVDSRNGLQNMPTLIVGGKTGQSVIQDANGGIPVTVRLEGSSSPSCDTDVWGFLPGANPNRYIVVGTPTSAFDSAASERGAGVAALVALARRWGAVPVRDRPVGLVFAGLSGHETGYLGLPVLMETHPDWFSMTDAYVHLGASIAASDGTRSLYVSENPALQGDVLNAFGLFPQVPPSISDPGEQAVAYAGGVPMVGESGTSTYFHTANDTYPAASGSGPDVDPAQLVSQAAAFNSLTTALSAAPAGQIRNQNLLAMTLAQSSGVPPLPVRSCADPTPIQPGYAALVASTSLSLGLLPTYEHEQPGFAWQGRWQERTVQWPSSATGAQLQGVVFAPNPPPAHPVPAVVIVPGSGPGVQSFYQWAARDLAGHGYVAVTVDPQGVGQSATLGSCSLSGCPGVPFQQDGNYEDAVTSGIDMLLSPANPYRAMIDPTRIGAAGHSLAARAVSYLQGTDKRIGAIVAWDNLAADLNGDNGSASGGPPLGNLIGGELPGPSMPVTPRVPALGEASDSSPHSGADVKKTAFAKWEAAKVASMELVFGGSSHNDWAQSQLTSSEVSLRRFEYYTRAWFDLWLRHDASALDRLEATSVAGTDRTTFLSTKFHSALFVPGVVRCEEFETSCP